VWLWEPRRNSISTFMQSITRYDRASTLDAEAVEHVRSRKGLLRRRPSQAYFRTISSKSPWHQRNRKARPDPTYFVSTGEAQADTRPKTAAKMQTSICKTLILSNVDVSAWSVRNLNSPLASPYGQIPTKESQLRSADVGTIGFGNELNHLA
jgi:hypothetical protein